MDNRDNTMRKDGDEERLRVEAGVDDGDYFSLPGPPYRWGEIEEYFSRRQQRPERMDQPEEIRDCEFCGEPTTQMWWSSHPRTWQRLCGSAGDLEYCLSCKAWYPVWCAIEN